MARKVVVFADGTGNTVDRHDSNVLRLCRMLDLSDGHDQVAIYDPGVGATASIDRLRAVLGSSTRLRLVENQIRRHCTVQFARLPFEWGFGLGTAENIRQLYGGLIEEYQPGAEIYLFGFSRGAFTIRALAGLIYRCGLPKRRDSRWTDRAMNLYRMHYEACGNDRQLRELKSEVEDFKRERSHLCDIRFMGIWDTVKAVGYIWPKNLPHIRHNPIVQTVRHAVSLSERRTFYVQTTWGGLDGDTRPAIHVPAHLVVERASASRPTIAWQDVKEIWFAGDHSDVGGGRPAGERALADVSLHWMINEAHEHGLRVCPDKYRQLAEDVPGAKDLSPAHVHDELRDHLPRALGWWIAEFAPRRDIVNEPPPPKRPPRILWPAGRRKLAPAARSGVVLVHGSAKNCYGPDAPPWKGVEVRFVETTERVLQRPVAAETSKHSDVTTSNYKNIVSRNLIVLSDGTGNSASKPFKTNVWRLYQTIDLRDGSQIAVFGDGVGTSSIKVLRVLGLALGIGVKRNVLNLYKFLCRNYKEGDKIWAFGFSRGAFTIRLLVGLIYREGLVAFESEAELERNALAAYRAYRRRAFATWIPWVLLGRMLRDFLVSVFNAASGTRRYPEVQEEAKRLGRGGCGQVKVHFLGVWDTVVAYGLPIDELTQAVDKWVWPMKFRDDWLLVNVDHARQALSLDDERRTFHPVPWSESREKDNIAIGKIPPGRIRQVWFAGAHAAVGGGYPDDGLSLVPLCWMIDEARAQGLRFERAVVEEYEATASPTGRIYDPRTGFGALWRYQPRDAQLLLGPGITPLVHGSVMTRIACSKDGYAPISLPEKIEVWPPYGAPVAFEPAALEGALTQIGGIPIEFRARQEAVLSQACQFAPTSQTPGERAAIFKLVLDTVWWRRVVYFVSLGLAVVIVAFPFLAQYLSIPGVTGQLNDRAGGSVGSAVGLVKGFLPGFVEPWTTAIVRSPAQAAIVVILLILSLRISGLLQRRIADRARAAWNLHVREDRMKVDPLLRPRGQRRGLFTATLVCAGLALVARWIHAPSWLWWSLAGLALLSFVLWAFRMGRPATAINPSRPGFPLNLARALRTSELARGVYRYAARTLAPLVFIVLTGILALSLVHRAAFDLRSTMGDFCDGTPALEQESEKLVEEERQGRRAQLKDLEKLGSATFRTDSKCYATGIRLVSGGKYRIKLTMDEGVNGEWFDKDIRTDVTGFTAHRWRHFVAAPLKRWWWQNWFQPIARIGKVGNYEHVLEPLAPLTPVEFEQCNSKKSASDCGIIQRIAEPATDAFKEAELECERQKGIRPNRVLVSDITANASGELFIYVNDAVLALPKLTDLFYLNNSGTATITVERILATPIVGATETQ